MRLVRLLDTPNAIGTIAPLVIREMCYWILFRIRSSLVLLRPDG
ncbi:AraC family transcriptional regulator N-terminal domain-containing protein [Paraburkholderia aromaticivorans]